MINFFITLPSILYVLIKYLRPSYTAFEFNVCGYSKPIKLLPCMGFLSQLQIFQKINFHKLYIPPNSTVCTCA